MHLKNLISTFKRQAKWLRISTYLIATYLIYALLLGVITPLALQSQLPSILKKQLGRNITIEKIRINPFLLRITLENFEIEEAHNQQKFFHITQLEADAGFWQTLVHLTPTLEHIYVQGPYVRLVRTLGGDVTQFNFSDIINTLNNASSEQSANTQDDASEIAHIRIGKLTLNNGHVQLVDMVTGTELDYPELAFTLNDLDSRTSLSNQTNLLRDEQTWENSDNYYQFKLVTAEGGTAEFDGQFQLSPIKVNGSIALNNIALSPLWPLSDNAIEAQLTDGLLDLKLRYILSQENDTMRLQTNNAQLALKQLAIADNEHTKIKINRLNVNNINVDSKTQRVDIVDITVDNPWVDVGVNNDEVDLLSMFTPTQLTQTSSNVSSASPSLHKPSWALSLQSFHVNNANVNINESAVSDGMLWQVSPINISTGKISSDFIDPILYELTVELKGGRMQSATEPNMQTATITSEGAIYVNQQKVTGALDLSQFELKQLQAYIEPYLNLAVEEGVAAISGSFEADASNRLSFNGQANITSLDLTDGLKHQPLIKWQDMQVAGIQYQSDDNALAIENIMLLSPFAKLVIDENKQTNIHDIIVNQVPDTAIEPALLSQPNVTQDTVATSTTQSINIGKITIKDGSAYFSDNSLRPRFASGIADFNGNITALSSDRQSSAAVELNGRIDGYAPVTLKGAINPLIDDIYLDLNFSVSGAELTSVNPYSGTYMGHYIDKGLLSLDVTYRIQNNQLLGSNHVVIDQLTLGRETDSDQSLGLPLELAIALLEDSNGVIDLGLEVSGDLDNPSFGFGRLILNALGNLITKAVTAPFSLLANLVGSEDELNEINFPHGSSITDTDAQQKLTALAEALAKRPGLRVNIEGTIDSVADAYELAEQKLQRQLKELSQQDTLPSDLSPSTVPLSGPTATALATLFKTTTDKNINEERQIVISRLAQDNANAELTDEQIERALHITMYNQIRNTLKISNHELAALANSRAKAVKTYLVNNAVDANRLFITNSRHHLQADKSGVMLTLDAN